MGFANAQPILRACCRGVQSEACPPAGYARTRGHGAKAPLPTLCSLTLSLIVEIEFMDKSEAHVAKFLTHRGYTDVKYEPDGNIPPDFLVDGRIAVEVRILNQNYPSGKSSEGLEETAIPLWDGMKKLVSLLGSSGEHGSWFVFYDFKRPLGHWKKIRSELRSKLTEFM